MEELNFIIGNNEVVACNNTAKFLARISYDRKITYIPYVSLSPEVVKAIEDFARYDNLCSSVERPYEKELKPVAYEDGQWKAVKRILDKVAGCDSYYEYDENTDDIYVRNKKENCKKLCDFLSKHGIRNSLQTDQREFYTVVYSNLINQTERLNQCLFGKDKNPSGYQTVRVTFKEPLSEIDHIFNDTDSWGAASLKEWIDNYESSRFTPISDREAIITSGYNMDFIREWLNKQDIAESIENLD